MPDNGSTWLAEVPGFPGERCDARIVADVVALLTAYGLHLTDCYGGKPHSLHGEHPLGLAIDVVAVRRRLATHGSARASRRLELPLAPPAAALRQGPSASFSTTAIRDTATRSTASRPHLHVSWRHGPAPPFTRAPWVQTVLVPAAAPDR